jgi:hypothetical protein
MLCRHISSFTDSSGSKAIESALLSTRVLPLEIILPLFGVLAAFFVFSKKYTGRFFALSSFLLSMWLFVPLFLTQGYLFGFYIDYNRFLYFIILPIMIFIAVLIDHGSGFFAKIIDTYHSLTSQMQKTTKITHRRIAWFSAHMTRKTLYAGCALFFLLFSFIFLPIFMTPSMNIGETIQSFYQVMDNPGWDAIQWVKNNTPANSVFVSDALYGWWLGGFAQRPTLSAVDPQYLSLDREFNGTQFARNLLDTDYLVDNGLVQVRDDGGYLARHNPEILAKLNWTYFPYSFFTFDSNQIHIDYEVNGSLQSVYLDQLAVKEMLMENMIGGNDTQYATITVTRGNDFFNYTQMTTTYRGLRFVNLTTTVDSTVPGVSLDWVYMDVQSKGTQIPYNDNITIGMIDEGVKAFGQLLFNVEPYNVKVLAGTPAIVKLQYGLNGTSQGEIQIQASAYSVTDNLQFYKDGGTKNSYFNNIMIDNLNLARTPVDVSFEQVFDYRLEMQSYNVSYITCRYSEIEAKFTKDPSFSLVFINNEVAIFKVKGNLSQDG